MLTAAAAAAKKGREERKEKGLEGVVLAAAELSYYKEQIKILGFIISMVSQPATS